MCKDDGNTDERFTTKTLRVRRAHSLVITFHGHKLQVRNFLTRQAFECNVLALELLALADDWCHVNDLLDSLSMYSSASIADATYLLIEFGALLVQNTSEADTDEHYFKKWEWGVTAGLFHFGLRDTPWNSAEETIAFLTERARERPSPELYLTNESFRNSSLLPRPHTSEPLLSVMISRRSERIFSNASISMSELGDCLFSGLGITGFVEQPVLGRVPLTMTPSGGARNPYEAYIYALHVEGLAPGIYHYSAVDHSVGLVQSEFLPRPRELLGGQEWVDAASAIILLVANFDRTIWKYPHPNAYRVVLIEAGHIAQNIILAATNLDLASTPTCAVCHTVAAITLGTSPITQSLLHAVVMGRLERSDAPGSTRTAAVNTMPKDHHC